MDIDASASAGYRKQYTLLKGPSLPDSVREKTKLTETQRSCVRRRYVTFALRCVLQSVYVGVHMCQVSECRRQPTAGGRLLLLAFALLCLPSLHSFTWFCFEATSMKTPTFIPAHSLALEQLRRTRMCWWCISQTMQDNIIWFQFLFQNSISKILLLHFLTLVSYFNFFSQIFHHIVCMYGWLGINSQLLLQL